MKLLNCKSIIVYFFIIMVTGCFLLPPPAVPKDNDSGNEDPTVNTSPEISVEIASVVKVSGATYDMGSTKIGETKSVTFTVKNSGNAVLNLTGSTPITLTGTDSTLFAITTPFSGTTIAAGGSGTFAVTFTPTGSEGVKNSSITINNSDSDEAVYVINLQATATETQTSPNAEIGLFINNTEYLLGTSYDFGSLNTGLTKDVTITIKNSGSSELTLNGATPIVISGTDSGLYTVSTAFSGTTVAAGGSGTFVVTFAPTGTAGAKNATITVSNSDSDEGTYILNLTATAVVPTGPAEISLLVDNFDTVSGGTFNVGGMELGGSKIATFVIKNIGGEVLTLSGSTPITITGTDASLFAITTQVSGSTINPGSSVTFVVTYSPTGTTGNKTATVTIANSDSDEGTYTINLSANASLTASKIALSAPATIGNNQSTSYTVTVTNENGITATGFSGSISVGTDSGYTITPSTITLVNGTATGNFTISKDILYYNTDVQVTADYSTLTQDSKTVTLTPVFTGTEITSLSSGLSIISGTKYIAPGDAATVINVNGDITIGEGSTLVIYPGVTLAFGTGYGIINGGTLEVYGIDNRRVKLTASGTNWNGIVSGNTSGNSVLKIDGAYINKTSSRVVRVGTSSTNRGGDTTITNSRLEVIDNEYDIVFEVFYPKGGSIITLDNSVLVAENSNAIYFANNSDSQITANIRRNTIIGKGSSTPIAINITESSSTSVYTIDNNIISGSFNEGLYISSLNIYPYFRNNVLKVGGKYVSTSNSSLQDINNLFIDSIALAPPNTLTVTWDNEAIYTNYALGDYSLEITDEFPTLSQANNYSSMVGSLTRGHVNEKGAYSNGGYAPNYNE